MATRNIKRNTFGWERYRKAKQVNLPTLIEQRYPIKFAFDKSGKNGDAHGHGLRIGFTKDGRSGDDIWLTNGRVLNDAVQTVIELDKLYLNLNTSIIEAIKVIERFQHQSPSNTVKQSGAAATSSAGTARNIRLPPKADSKQEAELLKYAQSRSIGWSTINAAEQDGFLAKSADGLTFIGRDANNNIKQAETRFMRPKLDQNGKKTRFHCVLNSDRSYAPIFHGSPDSNEIHLVEGGFDALALREHLAREGKNDTIIMTGGKDNTRWLGHEHIKTLLNGKSVHIWRDNEKSAEVEEQAEVAYKQLEIAVIKAGGGQPAIHRPPEGLKDVAEMNADEKKGIWEQKDV